MAARAYLTLLEKLRKLGVGLKALGKREITYLARLPKTMAGRRGAAVGAVGGAAVGVAAARKRKCPKGQKWDKRTRSCR